MTPDEPQCLEALQELPDTEQSDSNDIIEDINMEDILNGDKPLEISHTGGEFAALAAELNRYLWKA